MIHTYKRKRTSLKSCSFYERLYGDPLAECSPITTAIEKNIANVCCSGDAKEAKHSGCAKDDLPDNSNFHQSLPGESFEAQPIKFKYVRHSKSLYSIGRSLHCAERMTEINAAQTDLDNSDCISFQSKLPLVDQNQDIPGQDTGPCSNHSLLGKQNDISDRYLGPSENSGSLHCDSYSHNHCINIVNECEAGQANSVFPDIDRCIGGGFSSKISNKEEDEMGKNRSNSSAKKDSESDCTSTSIMDKPNSKGLDGSGTDDSSCQNCHVKTKCDAPLLTYNRRSRKGEYSSRTYADLLSERTNYVTHEQILFESAGGRTHNDVPEVIEKGISENVTEHKDSFSPSPVKLTDGISAIGAVMSGQGNQKERNGCQLMDDDKVSKVTSFNNEVETGQLSDDAIKAPCTTGYLSNEESSTSAEMENSFKDALLGNSQNQDFSQNFSDKPDKVDLNLSAVTKCEGVSLSLQYTELQQYVRRHIDAPLSAEARMDNRLELLETMKGGVTETKALPNLNAQPPNGCGFISQNSKMLYSIPLPNGSSTNSKVLQLFPEGSTGQALTTSNSVTSNDCSVTMALPDSSIGPRKFIQNNMVEPSSSHERPKLLLDGIRSSSRPQMITNEAFRQNFPAFASYWSEDELDSLWVGVRRHGKDNWYIMLRDPKLRFSPWRTERDLAEKWIMEQTKLLGNAPSPRCQYGKPVGIPMPPPPFMPLRPGSMTRFLTDPSQLSITNHAYLNNQEIMLPHRLSQNANRALGNGTRLLNRRVRANRRSRNTENSWARFKARNDVIRPHQFPCASMSRNGISPPYASATFDHPQPRPPLQIAPLSLQYRCNSSQFHKRLNDKAVDISTRNDSHLSNSGLTFPSLTIHSAQPSVENPTDFKRPDVLINLDSDASSEGTISDDDK